MVSQMEPGREYVDPEPWTARWLDIKGFEVHRTAYAVTILLALTAWGVISLVSWEAITFFPIFPLAIWTPLLALHAAGTWGRRAQQR